MQLSHLNVLNSKIKHLIGSSADEVEIYTIQSNEHKFFRNLVNQRDTKTFLQGNQHLLITKQDVKIETS